MSKKLNWWHTSSRYDAGTTGTFSFTVYPDFRTVIHERLGRERHDKIVYDQKHPSLTSAMLACEAWFDERIANENS